MKAVFLTAGAAGMYCGSCMHDNSLAKAMRRQGVDCLLQPVYTPITTDEESVADEHLFFGGIHIYLLQQLPWLRWVPLPVRRFLDWKPLLSLATKRSVSSTSATQLGELAVSMLAGKDGRQADEVARLAEWLGKDVRPDAVVFSNLLIAGCLPSLRHQLPDGRFVVLLQGDDIFLDHLPANLREQAIELMRGLVPLVDRFVVHSRFYGNKMGDILQIPREKIFTTPLSIDVQPFRVDGSLDDGSEHSETDEFRLGYMARIAPEKGLHHLVESFISLADAHAHHDLSLHVAGWLGDSNQDYFDQLRRRVADAGLAERFVYHGSPSLDEKVRLLKSLDLLSVPTDYHEPKGLFVLEALAAGVPVIQPDHGAFPELIESTGGGLLTRPGDVRHLSENIARLKEDEELRKSLAVAGHAGLHERHTIDKAAVEMKRICFDD